MAAMRLWLDEQRVESSKFICRDTECGMLVCIEFEIAREAERFAERFSREEATVRPTLRTLP